MLVVTVNVRKHGDINKKRPLVKKTKEVLVEVLRLARST
jgi:phenylpyruvate tautomerase PptA (4-oxalocrotonate tautomerase family)